MTRKPDPARKKELLAGILDYLLDRSLATLSLRTLANALNVTTGTLVYQFGTRAEMIREIVQAISSRQVDIQEKLAQNPGDLNAYFDGLEMSWNWTLQLRNRKLQRMEFEAAMVETLDRDSYTIIRTLYSTWLEQGTEALRALGLSSSDAAIEARVLVNFIYGAQYDLVVNDNAEAATLAFHRLVARHRLHLEELIRQSNGAR